MNKFLVDTNVLVYLHSRTDPSKRECARMLFHEHQDIVVSTQVLNELANVLYKKRGESPEKIRVIIEDILSFCPLRSFSGSFETEFLALSHPGVSCQIA